MKRHSAGSAAVTASPDSPGHHDHAPSAFDAGDGYRLLRRLLAEAGLQACRVEPHTAQDAWTVFAIQSTPRGAWKTFSLSVDNTRLRDAWADEQSRHDLISHLANALTSRDAQA